MRIPIFIPIPIRLRTTYSAVAEARVPRFIHCEECGFQYMYFFVAAGQGTGTSPLSLNLEGAQNVARSQARWRLQKALENGCFVAPCPQCGRVQRDMIPVAQSEQYERTKSWARFVFGLGALAFLPALLCTLVQGQPKEVFQWLLPAFWIAFVLLTGGAAICFGITSYLSKRYDPNSEPVEERKKRAAEISISKARYMDSLEAGIPL